MQLLVFAAILFSLSATVLAQTAPFNTTLSYDPIYDNGNLSTTSITCSNGNNGAICKYCALTLSEIPGWPNIAGWNSDSCRTCWKLTLGPEFGNVTFNVRAIDAAPGGFTVGFGLMDAVTGGQALEKGRVGVVAQGVNDTACEQGQQGPAAPTCPPPGFGCDS